ncbi:hypothetical protein B0H14DRAFT_2811562 [Mycena olivaceomarginata]|nr:hypothetical protein B0H14DRAFT_2811562 [Mycena olivaceomarginata]
MSAPPYEEKPTSGADSGLGSVACLGQFKVKLLVDDSGSMGPDQYAPGGQSRWDEAENAVRDLIQEYTKHNPGRGVEIIFLNSNHGRKKYSEVTELFQKVKPWGGTPIWRKLQQILPYQHWWSRLLPQEEDFILIVISDGASDHPKRVEEAIIRAAKVYSGENATTTCRICQKHAVRKIGIQFLQIGNDSAATLWLKRLDDDLGPNACDIVDATTTVNGCLEGKTLIKALLGAAWGFLDRKGTAGETLEGAGQ